MTTNFDEALAMLFDRVGAKKRPSLHFFHRKDGSWTASITVGAYSRKKEDMSSVSMTADTPSHALADLIGRVSLS